MLGSAQTANSRSRPSEATSRRCERTPWPKATPWWPSSWTTATRAPRWWPAVGRLRDAAGRRQFERVLVHAPDCLSRHIGYLVLLEELQRLGVVVEFLNHPEDNSPEGQLLLNVEGAVAEYERAKIADRTRRDKAYWARQGAIMPGFVPYGYRYVPREGNRRGRLEINEAEAAVVREIFRSIAEEGLSCGPSPLVCRIRASPPREEASAGGPPPSGASCVTRHTPAPITTARLTTARPPEPAVLPMSSPRRSPGGGRLGTRPDPACRQREVLAPAQRPAPVSDTRADGLRPLWPPLRRRSVEPPRYYRCGHYDPVRAGADEVCRARWVRADASGQAVWEAVAGLLRDPVVLAAQYRRRLGEAAPSAEESEVARLTQELQRLQPEEERLLDAYQAEVLSPEALKARMAEFAGKRQALQQRLRVVEQLR